MPGPNSAPNGDTTVMRGHKDEVFMCHRHGKEYGQHQNCPHLDGDICEMVPRRWWLSERGRLETGKTK